MYKVPIAGVVVDDVHSTLVGGGTGIVRHGYVNMGYPLIFLEHVNISISTRVRRINSSICYKYRSHVIIGCKRV